MIHAPNRDIVKINTKYRKNMGLGNKTCNEVGMDRFNFTLISGTDYNASGTGNISLEIWEDNNYWRNYTIHYDATVSYDVIPIADLDALDETTKDIFLGIGLIAISAITGLLVGGGSAGFHTFMIGGIIISIISANFLYLALISVIYYLLKEIIFKVVQQ